MAKVQRKPSKAENTRLALLDAARRVIHRDGYAASRIADIASEAGKAVGVFYAYFTNKQDLFAALIDSYIAELEEMSATLQPVEGDERAFIRANVASYWATTHRFRAELAGLIEVAMTEPGLRDIWRRERSRGIRRFSSAIRRQQAQGLCLGVDPELGGSAIMGLVEFACFNWQGGKLDFEGREVDDEQAVGTLAGLIANALEMRPAGNTG